MSSIHPYARLTIYYLVHTTIVFVTLLSLALTLTRAFLELLNGGLGILQVTLRYASKHLEDHECATEAWRDIGREELKVRMTGLKWPSNGAEVAGAFKGAGSVFRVVDDGMEQVMAREFMKNRKVETSQQRQAREEMLALRKAVVAEPPGTGGLWSYAGESITCRVLAASTDHSYGASDNTTTRRHSREGNVPPYTQPHIVPQIQRPLEHVMPTRSRTAEEAVHGEASCWVYGARPKERLIDMLPLAHVLGHLKNLFQLSFIANPKLLLSLAHDTVRRAMRRSVVGSLSSNGSFSEPFADSAPLDHRREVGMEGGCIWTAAGQWERI
ncbi:BZ3500_MvSof-1268-A1-R1_Chr7-1g09194 [Microbotryum saponariae]|uniref:BZ3500_MvSof-1268-A1-R1_Chr7-1g09194 protein n=1 Tax=Microbotryum saponariae TaxID=289078 RepID=A0A2X0KWQ7_9BASI|nr:BZ3501_MvSof-1269-A2-R1_Chr7-1g08899 [Microbotryum saponariae]SDA02977.1 BZ3500_MvSof-1268-A1-R1_Chr7-1g09194 [Microbotryum saponariae]